MGLLLPILPSLSEGALWEPFWATRFLMVSSAWVPVFYGFTVIGKLLYHKVLPRNGPNKTAWSLSLLLNTSAWPGFAHTFLEWQTSSCHGGHQCAFLLTAGCADLSSCLPTPPVMEKAVWYQKHHLSALSLPIPSTLSTHLNWATCVSLLQEQGSHLCHSCRLMLEVRPRLLGDSQSLQSPLVSLCLSYPICKKKKK